jgi:Putative Flp pilus-assembly TadE/G-like
MEKCRFMPKPSLYQRGQALVLSMVLILMSALGMFYVFNTGQVSADKQRVVNTADAAAYSAALWRARSLNYSAYANRAMIANDVAVAQTLTLMSEVQHHKNLAGCMAGAAQEDSNYCNGAISYVLYFFPYIQAIFEYIKTALAYYDDGILPPVAMAEVTTRSQVINQALSATQVSMQATTNFLVMQNGVVKDVVAANDARFTGRVLPDTFENGTSSFVKRYSDEQRDRMANITKASLDPFSLDRRVEITVIPPACAVGIELKKYGSTSLSSDMNNWEASDTFSEWIRYLRISWSGISCKIRENVYSFGDRQTGGPADTASFASPAINGNAFRRARNVASQYDNADSEWSGSGSPPGGRWTTHYQGIPSFLDLDYTSLNASDPEVKNPMHKLSVLVYLPHSDLRTANNLNIGVGRFRMTEDGLQNRINALAAAEVYFKRPVPRAASDAIQVEYPSLFNPYWQARLAEPDLSQKAVALAYP